MCYGTISAPLAWNDLRTAEVFPDLSNCDGAIHCDARLRERAYTDLIALGSEERIQAFLQGQAPAGFVASPPAAQHMASPVRLVFKPDPDRHTVACDRFFGADPDLLGVRGRLGGTTAATWRQAACEAVAMAERYVMHALRPQFACLRPSDFNLLVDHTVMSAAGVYGHAVTRETLPLSDDILLAS